VHLRSQTKHKKFVNFTDYDILQSLSSHQRKQILQEEKKKQEARTKKNRPDP
jgi:hypothetical protein